MVPDRERKTLAGHSSRPEHQGHLGCGLRFFLLFYALTCFPFGLSLILSAVGIVPRRGSAPPWTFVCAGGLVLFVGVGLLAFFLRGVIRRRREERWRRASAGLEEPWLLDHPWDTAGAPVEQCFLPGAVLVVTIVFLCLALFHWAVLAGELPWFTALFLSIFDLVFLGVLGLVCQLGLHRLKYGKLSLLFDRFPFFLGGSLEARLLVPKLPGSVRRISFTLRCIEERPSRFDPRKGKEQGPRVLCDQVYGDVETVAVRARDPWGPVNVAISFPLPEGDFATRLREEYRRYWELEAKGEARGIDLNALFLVPVYSPRQEPAGGPAGGQAA